MIKGLVSTVIPVYNREQMLKEAVSSVLNQSYKHIEVIIIDDGSTDNTKQVARELSLSNKGVEYLRINNSGPAMARETGRKLAKGEFIQYLDSDDLLHPDKFSKQVAGLNSNTECGVSYCKQEYCKVINGEQVSLHIRGKEKFITMFPAMLGNRFWQTSGPMYRTNLLDKNGPWMDLKNQEDWEYDCRLATLGVRLHYCDEVLTTIRRHDNGHLGLIEKDQPEKLIDKTEALTAIYGHAMSAGIPVDSKEFIRFNRSLFMLARQCAKSGLKTQSKSLIELCKISAPQRTRYMEYLVYQSLSHSLGWTTIGKLSEKIDRIRR